MQPPAGPLFDWIEIALGLTALALLILASIPKLRAYRSLLLGGGILLMITAFIPRQGNALGAYVFAPMRSMHLPSEVLGAALWLIGAWLARSLLALVLRRTWFPDDYQPHARRLFADLASALIYMVAFIGILDTVLKEPISALLATSGVLAIVLGLALQNTLGDVFSGLAVNIERPFGAGDWITMNDNVEGLVMEVNWRATRLRTLSNDMIVVPNSVVAKAIVTNHRKLDAPHVCTVALAIDSEVPPSRVFAILQSVASSSAGLAPDDMPRAYACGFTDSLVNYELYFAVDHFADTAQVRSAVIRGVIDALQAADIRLGAPATDVRLMQGPASAGKPAAVALKSPF